LQEILGDLTGVLQVSWQVSCRCPAGALSGDFQDISRSPVRSPAGDFRSSCFSPGHLLTGAARSRFYEQTSLLQFFHFIPHASPVRRCQEPILRTKHAPALFSVFLLRRFPLAILSPPVQDSTNIPVFRRTCNP